jgi:hypothetical protein
MDVNLERIQFLCGESGREGGSKMKKRSIIVAAPLIALVVTITATASAEEIGGRGTIWAEGLGLAILRGSGEVQIQSHGAGLVWVKDAESLEATGEGHKWEIPETKATVLAGWSGTIRISGHNMTIWMVGGVIEFTASGAGRVYLRGRGTYEINGSQGVWSSMGEILPLVAATERP